jgi:hypothetical protein
VALFNYVNECRISWKHTSNMPRASVSLYFVWGMSIGEELTLLALLPLTEARNSSDLSIRLVEHLSKAKDTLAKFSSHMFIADSHKNFSEESDHEYLTPADHVDFATGKPSDGIIYGLSLDQVQLSEELQSRGPQILVCTLSYLLVTCAIQNCNTLHMLGFTRR